MVVVVFVIMGLVGAFWFLEGLLLCLMAVLGVFWARTPPMPPDLQMPKHLK